MALSIRKKSSAKPYGRDEMIFDGMAKDRLLATLEQKYFEEQSKKEFQKALH
ncbi:MULTISPECIES: hypothetical protein [Caproicibacterium]|uniref:Uncharacterized protein n=1 Tax=Caproicibacterium argilliputei TaxID=3030016 RepID=A0AA97DDH8_9FIRM|nr:hypothetical protein [Caproicibacterium argilliputei]WOC33503.1 hypothetical protein PXC00_06460 [Caproicibacterium argilliputei]